MQTVNVTGAVCFHKLQRDVVMKKLKPRHAGKKPGPGQVPKPWLEIESDLVVLRERLAGLRNWLCLTIVPAVGPPDFSLETKAKESERELREGEERPRSSRPCSRGHLSSRRMNEAAGFTSGGSHSPGNQQGIPPVAGLAEVLSL
jgi:hypothetical protein